MKRGIVWFLLDAIFLIVFNICFFLIIAGADELPSSVWVSYAFIHISYILLLCTPLMVRQGNKAMTDYRRPLFLGTWTYFIAVLIVNITFILVSLNSTLIQLYEQLQLSPRSGFTAWLVHHLANSEGITAAWLLKLLGTPISATAAWVVNIILFAAIAVFLLVNILVNDDTAKQQERHEKEARFVDTTAPRLKYLADNASNKTAASALEKAYYSLKSSPLCSCSEANGIEHYIQSLVSKLETCSDDQETLILCGELSRLVQQRNRIVKDNN